MSEAIIGIRAHLTRTRGIGGEIPGIEDFIVEEIPLPRMAEGRRYTVARVQAKNWETNRLVSEMARRLGIGPSDIHFAGMKDKRAVTTQIMSFRLPSSPLSQLRMRGVEITPLYATDHHLRIGDLWGNRFQVRIQAMDQDISQRVEGVCNELLGAGGLPNFFGPQRFGTTRPITHLVGRQLVKGNIEGATLDYLTHPSAHESEEIVEARKRLRETRNYQAALGWYPEAFGFERRMIRHLARKPEDWVGALRQLPFNLRRLFIHAYQSLLFNEALSERLIKGLPINDVLVGDVVLLADRYGRPGGVEVEAREDNLEKVRDHVKRGEAWVSGFLLGYESTMAKGEQGSIERAIIERERIEPSDFILPALPEVSSKGLRRSLLAPLKTLEYTVHQGKVTLSFELPRGCYATALTREIQKRLN